MSDTSTSVELPVAPAALQCDVSREALPWMVAGMGGTLASEGSQIVVEWPVDGGENRRVAGPPKAWSWNGDAFLKLRSEYEEAANAVHAQPAGQPSRVHEISEALLAPYRAVGGRVHLGGCTLDWMPVWRELVLAGDPGEGNGAEPTQLNTRFRDAAGEALEERDGEALGDLSCWPAPPADPGPAPGGEDVLISTCVWRCWVRGRVVAEIGDESLSVDVEGWAAEVAAGKAELPPFDIGCGHPSHATAVDSEGSIGPETAIAVCAESKQRLLCSKMQRCGSSEVWVHPKHVLACPVTGVGVRESEMIRCNMCQQQVAPQAISSGRCEVCRSLKRVAKEDAQVARILGEFPRLDEWSSWRIGENRDCWILTAGGWFYRLLVVVKKEPVELLHVATGLRWVRGWSEASEEMVRELRASE